MKKSSDNISVLQASMLIVTSIGILDHVIIIPFLLRTAGRDAWLSVVLAGIFFLGFFPLLYFVMKRCKQQPIPIWLKNRIGVIPTWILIGPVILDLFVSVSMTVRDVSTWANISYLPDTPNIVIVCCFLLASVYLARSGLRSVAQFNFILLPFVILLGFLIMSMNSVYKDYSLLKPVLENGVVPVVKGLLFSGVGLIGLVYFLLLQHKISSHWVGFPYSSPALFYLI